MEIGRERYRLRGRWMEFEKRSVVVLVLWRASESPAWVVEPANAGLHPQST